LSARATRPTTYKMDQAREEEARSLVNQLEMGKRQMDTFRRQAEMIEGAIVEINSALDTIKAMGKHSPGDEILVQVGSGSFMRAQISDAENVLVGIGGNLTAEKKAPEALEILDVRGKKLAESLDKLQKTMGDLAMRMAELNKQAESMIGPMG